MFCSCARSINIALIKIPKDTLEYHGCSISYAEHKSASGPQRHNGPRKHNICSEAGSEAVQ